MNVSSPRCRLLCAGSLALALASCVVAPFAGATEQLRNPTFDTAGGAEWSKAAEWLVDPFSNPGEVSLSLDGGWTGKLIWQDLDISNVDGVSGTAHMHLRKNSAPTGNTVAVYLDYLDGDGIAQSMLLLNPANDSVEATATGTAFSAPFTVPAGAQKITGFSIHKTYSGSFYALEFGLDLQQAVPGPVVSITTPANGATLPQGVTIPLRATVEPNGSNVSVLEFHDGGTLIGIGQPSVYGEWIFPDGGSIAVIPDASGALINYLPKDEGRYEMHGVMWSDTGFQGLFTHWPAGGDVVNGSVGISFTLKVDGTLSAFIMSSDSPLGYRTLDGGINASPQYSFSLTNATLGAHGLTAQANYGTGQHVTSAPVNITVVGVPVIVVEQPVGTALTSGADPVWCGQSVTGIAEPLPVTFTLKNTGTAMLSDILVTKEGANADDFVVTSAPAGSVEVAGSTTMTVTFTPSGTDLRTADLSIASNDTAHTPFILHLTGYGVAPPTLTLTSPTAGATFPQGATIPLMATVDAVGTSITNVKFYDGETLIGTGLPGLLGEWSFSDGSRLSVMAGEGTSTMIDYAPPSPERMYFMGGAFLPESPLVYSGMFFADSDSGNVGITFSHGANATITAVISGDSPLGERTLTGGTNSMFPQQFALSLLSADPGPHVLTARAYYGTDQSVTSDPVTITVEAIPIIVVEQPAGTALTSGADTISFGPSVVGVAAPSPVTFTLKNTGAAPLSGIVVTSEGANADDYVVTNPPASTVEAGGSTTFTVTFTPSAIDTRTADLSIASNDTTHTPFILKLTGSGVNPPLVTISSPLAGATFASGVPIPLVATVDSSGGSVTGLEFYADGTLIGSGQIGLYGWWNFADRSSLSVHAGAEGNVMADYTLPDGAGSYMSTGSFPYDPLLYFGTFSHRNGTSMDEGQGGITFSFGTYSTLNAAIFGMLLNCNLTGGTCENPTFTLSWPDASNGAHVLTARAYYGTGRYATSEPVSINVGAATPAIVVNGDFETGASTPWSAGMGATPPAPVAAAAHAGQYGLEVTGTGPPAWISQEIQTRLTADTLYRFTAWVNLLQVNATPGLPPIYLPHLSIHFGTPSSPAVIARAINETGLGWQKLEVSRSFSAAELQGSVVLEVGGFAKFQMDDVSGARATLTGYDAWVQTNFTPAEQSQGLAHASADPDGRGVSNLLRYGLGLIPRDPQRDMLPRLTHSSANPAKIAFEFSIPAPPPAGVEYLLGVSSDLKTWDETALAALTLEFDQTYTEGPLANRRLIRVVAPDPAPGQSRCFITLVVRQPAGTP